MKRRYSFTLDEDQADVLDALACLAGYTGRPGAWVGDQVRGLVTKRAADPDVRELAAARAAYRQTTPRLTRHGFGVIDGGAAS